MTADRSVFGCIFREKAKGARIVARWGGEKAQCMRRFSVSLPKTIAAVRIATACFFLLFGQYKLFDPAFAHGGFQQYLQSFGESGAVSFYQPVLVDFVLPRAVFFGYLVGAVEFAIGLAAGTITISPVMRRVFSTVCSRLVRWCSTSMPGSSSACSDAWR